MSKSPDELTDEASIRDMAHELRMHNVFVTNYFETDKDDVTKDVSEVFEYCAKVNPVHLGVLHIQATKRYKWIMYYELILNLLAASGICLTAYFWGNPLAAFASSLSIVSFMAFPNKNKRKRRAKRLLISLGAFADGEKLDDFLESSFVK